MAKGDRKIVNGVEHIEDASGQLVPSNEQERLRQHIFNTVSGLTKMFASNDSAQKEVIPRQKTLGGRIGFPE